MTAVPAPVRQLDALLSSLAAEDVHAQPDEALLAEIHALQAAGDRMHAEMLRRIAVADSRGATTTHYGIGTRAWLRASARMSDAAASGAVRLARALRDLLPARREGVSTGAVTLEQARVIDRHVRDLPPDRRAEVEKHLAEQATRFGADDLRVLARRAREAVAPELSERSFRERYESRWLTWNSTLDGMLHLEGMLDPIAGQLVRNALDPLTLPLGPHDDRTADQRRADALVELCTVEAARPSAGTAAESEDEHDRSGDEAGGAAAARPQARRSPAQLLDGRRRDTRAAAPWTARRRQRNEPARDTRRSTRTAVQCESRGGGDRSRAVERARSARLRRRPAAATHPRTERGPRPRSAGSSRDARATPRAHRAGWRLRLPTVRKTRGVVRCPSPDAVLGRRTDQCGRDGAALPYPPHPDPPRYMGPGYRRGRRRTHRRFQ